MPDPIPAAVLWDVDGTLVDTAALHFAAWEELTRDRGLPFSRADFDATFGWRNPEIIRKLFGTHYPEDEIAELGARKEELYRAAAGRGVTLLPGVRPLLEGLHAAGFRQGVGSSAPRANLDLILHLTDTARYFDAVTSMEDTERGKPDPQVFLVTAAKLGVDPARCLVIEDAPVGVQAARAGGMQAIAVRSTGHPPEALRQAGAALVVETLEAVTPETVRRLVGPS
jgi:beta-phosphoglucomutase